MAPPSPSYICDPALPPHCLNARPETAFTLVELLAVMGIIVLMMGLLLPAFIGIKGGGDVTKAAYDIAGVLDNARNYAMANNTFTWVGFFEDDPTATSTTPATSGTGRLVVAAVASKDGTRGYDITSTSLPNPAWSSYNNGANFIAIGKLQKFENLHLAPLFSSLPNTGGLARPTVSDNNYQIGNTGCTSYTPIYWPLGTASATCQYAFIKVINFNPQGTARIQTGNEEKVTRYIDIGLIPTHGNVVPALPITTGNCAAVQVSAMNGATRIYRP